MLTKGLNPSTGEIESIKSKDGRLTIRTDYEDLGPVIDTTAIAAGAYYNSQWYDGVEWVRNVKVQVQTDQNYDVGFTGRDTSLNFDSGSSIANTTSSPSSWKMHIGVGANGIPGYGIRFFIKNNGAAPTTFAKVRAQLLGL